MNKSCKPIFKQNELLIPYSHGKWNVKYRNPNLLVSKKGTIFIFPEARLNSIGDDAKNELVCKRSLDNGKTWRDLEILLSDEDPRVGVHYVCGVADFETGRMFVFYCIKIVITPEDIGSQSVEKWEYEHPEEADKIRRRLAQHVEEGIYLIWTGNEGNTWSSPQQIGDAFNVDNPVTGERRKLSPTFIGTQLQYGKYKGRLILPGRGMTKGGTFDLFAYAHDYVVYSDDHGRTWQPGGLLQNGTGEACLVEEIDGTIYVNSRNESLRCRGYRAWGRSYDGGKTFLESGYDLALPEPHCKASMVRYSGPPDGRSRVLFCNPAMTTNTRECCEMATRRNLTVRISYDECRTWPVGRTVCEGPAGYSALAVTNDGWILCAYETMDSQGCTGSIILTRFNLEWLTQDQKELPIV